MQFSILNKITKKYKMNVKIENTCENLLKRILLSENENLNKFIKFLETSTISHLLFPRFELGGGEGGADTL